MSDDDEDEEEIIKDLLNLKHLPNEDAEDIEKLCLEFENVFYMKGDPLKSTNILKHSIKTTDNKVINVRPYRLPYAARTQIREQVNDLIKKGVIENSKSPWNAPILIVPKKMDNSGEIKYRMVVDYRRLNEITVGDTYPLPLIGEILELLGNMK